MQFIKTLKFIFVPKNRGEEAVAAAALFLVGMMIFLH
jgi:hypothetical protein